jgi:hypothetical protein
MIEVGDGFASVWLPINPFVVVYLVGVAIGLIAIDARGLARVGLALLWPVGPIAFILTITILLLAALIAFPVFGLIAIAVAVAAAVVWGIGL